MSSEDNSASRTPAAAPSSTPSPAAAPSPATVATARPRRIVVFGAVAAAVVLGAAIVLGVSLGGMQEGAVTFHTFDQAGIIAVGVLGAAAIMLVARPRVRADRHGIAVRNLFGDAHFEWTAVDRIAFPPGAHWAQLVLIDDEVYPIMAIQAMDKHHAVASLRALRALYDRYAPTRSAMTAEQEQQEQRRRRAEAAAAAARPLGRLEMIDRDMAAAPPHRRRSGSDGH